MKFKKICRAAYDFDGSNEGELSNVKEGDLLCVLEDGNDDEWLTARHKSHDSFSDSITGLIPSDYVQDTHPEVTWKAIYEYKARTEDEISFPEGASLDIYERNDPEWWLARYDTEVGLVPATYVSKDGNPELDDEYDVQASTIVTNRLEFDTSGEAAAQKAAFLTAIEPLGPPKPPGAVKSQKSTEKTTFERAPELMYYDVTVDEKKIKTKRKGLVGTDTDTLYFVNENDKSVLNKWPMTDAKTSLKGKRLTVEIDGETVIIEGDKSDLQAVNKKLEDFNRASKISRPMHVTLMDTGGSKIMDIPSRPTPFSSGGLKMAVALYDYMAQTDEELSIQENDNLMILDDSDSEWIKVRIISKGGRAGEGLVPYNYIEHKQRDDGVTTSPASLATSAAMPQMGLPARPRPSESVAPAMPQRPQVHQSIVPPPMAPRPAARQSVKPMAENVDKPDPSNVRRWTDKTGSFKVEAEFLSVSDGKVHLHKVNGVKIAVPLEKLDPKDIAYIKTMTGEDLSIPSGDAPPLPPRETLVNSAAAASPPPLPPRVVVNEAPVVNSNSQSILVPAGSSNNYGRDTLSSAIAPGVSYSYNGFNWRNFLVQAGVGLGDAEKYAARFVAESLDKNILEDVDRDTFKALGVTEGDIIRIRKHAPLSQNAAIRENKILSKNDADYAKRLADEEARQKPMDPKRKAQLEKEDEEFARRLQAQEMGIPVKALESSYKGPAPVATSASSSNVKVPQPPVQPIAPVATTPRRVSGNRATIDEAKIFAASKVLGAAVNKDISNSKELIVKSKESNDDVSWMEKIAIKESLRDAEHQKKVEDLRAGDYKYRQDVRDKQSVQRKYLTDSSNISFNPSTGELSAPYTSASTPPSTNTRLSTGSSNYGIDNSLSGLSVNSYDSSGFGNSSTLGGMRPITSGGGFEGRSANLPSYAAPPPTPPLSTKPGGSLAPSLIPIPNSNALVLGSSSISSNSFNNTGFGNAGLGGYDSISGGGLGTNRLSNGTTRSLDKYAALLNIVDPAAFSSTITHGPPATNLIPPGLSNLNTSVYATSTSTTVGSIGPGGMQTFNTSNPGGMGMSMMNSAMPMSSGMGMGPSMGGMSIAGINNMGGGIGGMGTMPTMMNGINSMPNLMGINSTPNLMGMNSTPNSMEMNSMSNSMGMNGMPINNNMTMGMNTMYNPNLRPPNPYGY